MGDSEIHEGARVVGTQVPGVFTVVTVRGHLVEIESDRGLRMTVLDKTLRRLDGEPPAPKDEAE